ncbi:hypothetical protein FOMA001_g17228 [Fusarium oxysporum f. sp. matthiolae]|nr:hypothetical protein FOMA001_g17228 [Fusarium oxysporum f. sp. matthiolae]
MNLKSLITAPIQGHKSTVSRRSTSSCIKSVKPVHRASKRASSGNVINHHHNRVTQAGMDGRRNRAWKACERCRTKKTKCDGNFPCKRCKDDGLICTASVRKKRGYKKLPLEYAAVFQNTQLILIATIHKLYSMVRNSQPWELGEPDLNDRGLPVVHNIAQKLDCIRPNSDIDLPWYVVFPEDEAGMVKLALQLEEKQKEKEPQKEVKDADSSVCHQTELASSSELDHTNFECDYLKAAFGNNNAMTLSAQIFTGSSSDVTLGFSPPEIGASDMFRSQSSSISNLPSWPMATEPRPSDLTLQSLQQPGLTGRLDMLNQDLVESDSGTILTSCHLPGPEIPVGMGDPMIYSCYDGELMQD